MVNKSIDWGKSEAYQKSPHFHQSRYKRSCPQFIKYCIYDRRIETFVANNSIKANFSYTRPSGMSKTDNKWANWRMIRVKWKVTTLPCSGLIKYGYKLHRSTQLRLLVRRWRSLCLYSLVEVKYKLFVCVHYRYNVGQGSAGSQLPACIGTQGFTLGARRLRRSHLWLFLPLWYFIRTSGGENILV